VQWDAPLVIVIGNVWFGFGPITTFDFLLSHRETLAKKNRKP
jgi:hypothetical protein